LSKIAEQVGIWLDLSRFLEADLISRREYAEKLKEIGL